MRVLLIGCVKSTRIFLYKLIELKVNIVGVITKLKSGFNADFEDIGKVCRENFIDYIYTDNINDKKSREYIIEKQVDLILCFGWSQLLKEDILNLPRIGCIGFHPAELPYNRGRHPLIWALVLGLTRTASTFFFMDSGADTGAIISQKKINIEYEDDANMLYTKVMKIAVLQLENVLKDLENNNLKSIVQNNNEGNVWRKRGKEDGRIDWRMSSKGIYNLVRALTRPYIGAYFIYKSKEYKVWKVREIVDPTYDNIEPGKVLIVCSLNQFVIKTGENLIEVLLCDDVELHVNEYLS